MQQIMVNMPKSYLSYYSQPRLTLCGVRAPRSPDVPELRASNMGWKDKTIYIDIAEFRYTRV